MVHLSSHAIYLQKMAEKLVRMLIRNIQGRNESLLPQLGAIDKTTVENLTEKNLTRYFTEAGQHFDLAEPSKNSLTA